MLEWYEPLTEDGERMSISKREVEYVARLARLGLSEAEKDKMSEQLSRILEHIAVLNRLDTSNVPQLAHVLPVQNVFRPDVVSAGLTREAALSNAPEAEAGCFRVPKITED